MWDPRFVVMLTVPLNVPVAGSYSSALDTDLPLGFTEPPAIKTLPSASSVAVWPKRAMVIEPVRVNVPDDCASAMHAQKTIQSGKKLTLMLGPLLHRNIYW